MLPARAALVAMVLLLVTTVVGWGQSVPLESLPEERALLVFNHHVGGMVVLILAGLTWLEVLETRRAARLGLLWPCCLILIGLYNTILSDKFAWPIGPRGFWESLSDPEIFQHKILAVLVLALGLIELFRRLEWTTRSGLLSLFYALALLAGGMVFFHGAGSALHQHSHQLLFSHALMGSLALLALAFKVLVDHRILVGRSAQLYPLVLMGLGLQLLLYTE